ncbi:MAG: YARHG domain-containing protein [Alphaproteobacteria bacterium]
MLLRGLACVGIATACLFGSAVQSPVQAACYEEVGCTNKDNFHKDDLFQLSCQTLGEVRNSIYAENGYCFKSSRYRRMFGNENCEYETSEDVPLNRYERRNVDLIRRVERAKECD